MIAWAHVLAWPVAAVVIAVQFRRAAAALAIALWSKDYDPLEGLDLTGPTAGRMEPVEGFEPKDAGESK